MFQSFFKRGLGMVMLAALVAGPVQARTLSDLDAVHQAATQRTLVMRVAKAHLQLATEPHDAYRVLNASIDEYDRNLAELEANSPNSDLNRRLLQLKKDWQAFKRLAMAQPSRDTVQAILEDSDNLLYRADSLVRQWQLRLPQAGGQYHEQALHQSMLSERIGLLYAAHNFGVNEPWVLEELNFCVREYEKGMQRLQTAAREQGQQPALDTLQHHWDFARQGLQKVSEGQAMPAVLTVAMESLYGQSNKLGEQLRKVDRIALQAQPMKVGLAANVAAD